MDDWGQNYQRLLKKMRSRLLSRANVPFQTKLYGYFVEKARKIFRLWSKRHKRAVIPAATSRIFSGELLEVRQDYIPCNTQDLLEMAVVLPALHRKGGHKKYTIFSPSFLRRQDSRADLCDFTVFPYFICTAKLPEHIFFTPRRCIFYT